MPDKKFTRIKDDIVVHVILTYPQLTFGSQVEIENIDGSKVNIKIPKGCPVGKEIIVSSKGFARLRSTGYGNLVVVTQCHIPKKLSKEAKEKLKEYAQLIGSNTEDDNSSIAGFFKKFIG